MKLKIVFVSSVISLLLAGCSKTTSLPQNSPPETKTPPAVNLRKSGKRPGTDKSDRPYNLNIVYFVPKDLDTLVGYQKRLDEMMIWGQQWFHDNMKRYSYDKTFGMLTDEQGKKVRITTIYGSKTSSQYTLEGGAKSIWKEIEEYYTAHPQERLSDHFLNIVPRYSFKASGEPTGPPYHGATYDKNRTCFVLDYEDMDMKYMDDKTDKGKWFRLYYGGLLHELGHALNLPHNMQTVSELNDPTKGTSMMHNGNHTLGTKPTFLTPADCEMLSVNQLFNKEQKTYYENAKARVTEISGVYDAAKGAIILSGKYETDVPLQAIAVYNDPQVNNEGIGTNKDYNALSFATKPLNGNRFYLEMPVTDFTFRNNEDYEIKIFLIHENGLFSNAFYSYRFSNNIPTLNIDTRPENSKAAWSIAEFSSEESGEGKATAVIDKNLNTYWHSRWSSNAAVYPHSITINVGTNPQKAKGLVYHSREGAYRHIKNFELFISTDGINFSSAGEYQTIYSQGPQYFAFDSEKTIKTFKVVFKSSWDGTNNAAVAELGLY